MKTNCVVFIQKLLIILIIILTAAGAMRAGFSAMTNIINAEITVITYVYTGISIITLLVLTGYLLVSIRNNPKYYYKLKGKPTAEEVIEGIQDFIFSLDGSLTHFIGGKHSHKGHIICLFTKFGWKYAGSGMYAVVFTSPCGNYALKINLGSEDNYPYYAQMAIDNPKNKYMPNIYWHIHLLNRDIIKSVTLMECLSPIGTQFTEKIAKSPSLLNFFYNKWKFILNERDFSYVNDDKDVVTIITGFQHINSIVDYFHFDMNNGNWMQRSNGQLVLTDPIV